MIAQIVRFRSAMTDEGVLRMYEARAPRYRALQGLRQKIYLRFPDTEEHGAVYIWESEEAMRAFRESDLARTIPEVYQVQGDADVQMAEVVLVLRPDASLGPV